MKSQKLLFAALDQFTLIGTCFHRLKLNHPRVSNETYGRRSMLYVRAHDRVQRQQLEEFLQREGFRVSTTYNPKGSTVAVQVSYFKGHHWAE